MELGVLCTIRYDTMKSEQKGSGVLFVWRSVTFCFQDDREKDGQKEGQRREDVRCREMLWKKGWQRERERERAANGKRARFSSTWSWEEEHSRK